MKAREKLSPGGVKAREKNSAWGVKGAENRQLDQAIGLFLQSLGETAATEGSLSDSLGPVSELRGPLTRAEVELWRQRLTCPIAWAGLRFVGVCERRPTVAWTDDHARPAPESAREEARHLIETASERRGADASCEEALAELVRATPGSPTPEQAALAARLYRDRIASSHQHNVLAGLAWLHEALSGELPKEARATLQREAADLWLEMARGESQQPGLGPIHPGALMRARALLDELGATSPEPLVVGLRARLSYLEGLARSPADLGGAARGAWAMVAPHLQETAWQAGLEGVRFAITACELLVGSPEAGGGAGAAALAHADSLLGALPARLPGREWLGLVVRLVEARNALAASAGRPSGVEHSKALTPRELVRAVLRHEARLGGEGASGVGPMFRILSEAFDQLESAAWGPPSDPLPLMTASGTLGRAYRELLGHYARLKALASSDPAHVVACLQYACDLRLALRHNLARLAAWVGENGAVILNEIWLPLGDRDALWRALTDSLDVTTVRSRDGAARALDAFAHAPAALLDATPEQADPTQWVLGTLCERRAIDEPVARTAAYQAVRMATRRASALQASWHRIREIEIAQQSDSDVEGAPPLVELVDPGRRLTEQHAALQHLAEGHGLIALLLDEGRGLVGASIWHDARGYAQRFIRVADASVTNLLLDVLRPREVDETRQRGRCPERREAWVRLNRWLAPHLQRLCGDALTSSLHWTVLAPGPLRALPMLGLDVGDGRLAAKVETLVHAAALNSARVPVAPVETPRTACLLARNQVDGDTTFGEAAIATLRRAFPPSDILDPHELRGRTIVEVDALQPIAPSLTGLRLYGVGAPETINPTTTALRLEGQRALLGQNLARLHLGRCEDVELWACVTGGAAVATILRNDGDQLPGLVVEFLAAGARGVLDLAWPIPDLVKALVCEQFGFARARTGSGPTAFRYAVFACRGLLDEWANHVRSASSIREALAELDDARRFVVAKIHHGDPRCVVGMARGYDAPGLAGLTVPALLEEVTHPSHLAAFRWWGV